MTNATERLVFFSGRSESFYYFPFEAWGKKPLATLEKEFHRRLKRDNKLDESESISIIYDEESIVAEKEIDFNIVMRSDSLKSTTTLNEMRDVLSDLKPPLGGLDISFRLETRVPGPYFDDSEGEEA